MRDKYLRLERDMQTKQNTWMKERDDLRQTIEELKVTQEHLRQPAELIAKQSKDFLREKNSELLDALIGQERMTEKFKWELNKTAEAYEAECLNSDKLRRENNKLKNFLNVK